jgi:hypothetical protein
VAQSPRAKAKPKPDAKPKAEKPQIERFKELARSAGCDETGEAFERAAKKLLPARRRVAED